MKCPFCAEVIQNEAILCRFCGATKVDETWKPPAPPALQSPERSAARKTNFTIRTAAVFYLFSALYEEMSISSKIPLFGTVRGGALAVSYHLFYIVLLLAMGIGLWLQKAWGYKVMLAGTVIYTLDKMLFLLDHGARAAYISQQLQGYGEFNDIIDPGSLATMLIMTSLLSLACWWGFMGYLYFRRSSFEGPAKVNPVLGK